MSWYFLAQSDIQSNVSIERSIDRSNDAVLAMLAEVEKYDPGSRAAAAIVRVRVHHTNTGYLLHNAAGDTRGLTRCCCSRYLQALDEEVLDVYLDISPLEMKAAMIESKVKEAIKNHTPKRDELAYYT